jgi:hypothetical protein
MRPSGVPLDRLIGRALERVDRRSVIGLGFLVALALVLGVLMYDPRSTSSIRWSAGLLGLAILAALAWRRLRRGTADPEPLTRPAPQGAVQAGELAAFSQTLRRAARGLPFSQFVVASRARAAFLEKVRLAHGLSSESLRRAEADPDALRRLVRDDVLVAFLHPPTEDREPSSGWVLASRRRMGFVPAFQDVLDRMEAWR